MADEERDLDELAFAAKQDLGEAIDGWVEAFKHDTSSVDGFPTIDRIETTLVELNSKTRNILLTMASDAISSIDERGAVDSKKGS